MNTEYDNFVIRVRCLKSTNTPSYTLRELDLLIYHKRTKKVSYAHIRVGEFNILRKFGRAYEMSQLGLGLVLTTFYFYDVISFSCSLCNILLFSDTLRETHFFL